MSVRVEEFLPDVLLSAPSCPEDVALRAIRNTLRDFCRNTRIWQEWLDPETVLSGLSEADLDLPPETEKVAIIEARRDGVQIGVVGEGDLARATRGGMDATGFPFEVSRLYAGADWRQAEGGAILALIERQGSTVGVFPKLSDGNSNTIELKVALMPTLAAWEVADVLLDTWNETIAAGALWRVLKMPGQEWTEPKHAAVAQTEYRRGRAAARTAALKQFAGGSIELRPPKIVGMA